jgi:hypothetical protein
MVHLPMYVWSKAIFSQSLAALFYDSQSKDFLLLQKLAWLRKEDVQSILKTSLLGQKFDAVIS